MTTRKGAFILPLFLIILLCGEMSAQVENQVRGSYLLYYRVKERLRLEGNVGSWSNVENKDWSVFHAEPGVQYWIRPSLSLYGKVDFRYTWQRILDNLFEIRPWAGLRLHWPNFKNFSLDHRARVEMRVVSYRGNRREDNFDTAARFRYRLQIKTPNYSLTFFKRTDLRSGLLRSFLEHGRNSRRALY